MLERRTVFIIGAGAGVEINMPVGAKLAADISARLDLPRRTHDGNVGNGDRVIRAALQEHVQLLRRSEPTANHDENRYYHAAFRIRDGIQTADSIDDFLDRVKGEENADKLELCGKMAIVRSILDAESSSSIYVNEQSGRDKLDLNALANTWFMKLFRLLTRQHPNRNELFNNVTFINFNYDRCLEQFLLHALQPAFGISGPEAAQIVKQVRIYHPYGTVGRLPILNGGEGLSVPYGADKGMDLVALARQIKTYTEQMEEVRILDDIRREITLADRMVFLGFAYHGQNMNLITPENSEIKTGHGRKIYGTAYKMSNSDIDVVRGYMRRFYPEGIIHVDENIHLRSDLDCSKFFDEYTRTLAGS